MNNHAAQVLLLVFVYEYSVQPWWETRVGSSAPSGGSLFGHNWTRAFRWRSNTFLSCNRSLALAW